MYHSWPINTSRVHLDTKCFEQHVHWHQRLRLLLFGRRCSVNVYIICILSISRIKLCNVSSNIYFQSEIFTQWIIIELLIEKKENIISATLLSLKSVFVRMCMIYNVHVPVLKTNLNMDFLKELVKRSWIVIWETCSRSNARPHSCLKCRKNHCKASTLYLVIRNNIIITITLMTDFCFI